ncbi:MAG: hypothetical protein JOY90_23410 [Bradyrhizobium sp.]|uniref:hypothetical protein n=1 Tax=Bradyrhizobium sp. TaxID=376 RepID=UPI001D40E5DC|nr:hypothetical protein [Bradyrhizobium sp.]MBV9563367.1 hypothetical protein [Bradyrhizobium sp.]
MVQKRVLAIGIDPRFVDYAAFPPFTPELFRGFIAAQIENARAAGYDVTSCLIDLRYGRISRRLGPAVRQVRLRVIGTGLRLPPEHFLLFESIINLIYRLAPGAGRMI